MYRFIINKRYVNLLKAIARQGNHDVLGISRDVGFAYCRTSEYISQFAKEGIVHKVRLDKGPGIRVNISITEKGKEIIACFDKINEIMERKSEKEVKNGKSE